MWEHLGLQVWEAVDPLIVASPSSQLDWIVQRKMFGSGSRDREGLGL